MVLIHPSAPLDAALIDSVTAAIRHFLDQQRGEYSHVGWRVSPLFDLADAFCSGGKRLRPAFCYWAYVATGDEAPNDAIIEAAASLDLLHVSALVHDDVMDASDTRRGLPAAHRQFEATHVAQTGIGAADAYGRAGSILLGDLLLTLSAEMFDQADLEPAQRQRALVHLHALRTEVALGQFLDVTSQALPSPDADERLRDAIAVTEFKSARYSIRRPAQIGCALAGGDARLDAQLGEFGSPLGRAFQMRDDLLGVFGDPLVTGKPAGDDIREGKRTVLMALATAEQSNSARELESMLGRIDLTDSDIDKAKAIIVESGAQALAEARIADEFEQAMDALKAADITDVGREGLTNLALMAVQREY